MLCHLFSYICHIYVVDDGIRAHCLSNVWIAFLPKAIKTWWWNIDFYNCVHHGDDEQKKVVCCCQADVPHWLKISILESQLKECYDDWQGGYKECTFVLWFSGISLLSTNENTFVLKVDWEPLLLISLFSHYFMNKLPCFFCAMREF